MRIRVLAAAMLSAALTAGAIEIIPTLTAESIRAVIGNQRGFAVIRDMDRRTLVVLDLPDCALDTLPSESNEIKYLRISPDGKFVIYNVGGRIFCRGLGDNKMHRTELGNGGRASFWINPQTSDTFIVYSTHYEESVLIDTTGSDPTKARQYNGTTFMRKFSAGQAVGEPQQILNQSYKAGLSKDGKWLGTADKSPFLYDRSSRTYYQLPLHRNSSCWPVMNPTSDTLQMDQVAYLNTWHDSIIVMNSQDSVTWSMAYPAETYSPFSIAGQKWHSFGWSNHEDFMLSGIRLYRTVNFDSKDATQLFLALIRRSDKKHVLLGTGGFHQDLWLENAPEYHGEIVRNKMQRSEPGNYTRAQFAIYSPVTITNYSRGRGVTRYDLRGKKLVQQSRPYPTLLIEIPLR